MGGIISCRSGNCTRTKPVLLRGVCSSCNPRNYTKNCITSTRQDLPGSQQVLTCNYTVSNGNFLNWLTVMPGQHTNTSSVFTVLPRDAPGPSFPNVSSRAYIAESRCSQLARRRGIPLSPIYRDRVCHMVLCTRLHYLSNEQYPLTRYFTDIQQSSLDKRCCCH